MQKKIIVLAIASAAAFSAPAFADTTFYGLVDLAVAHASADGQKSDTQLISGGLSTSRVGLKSSEDMGNGMKAIVNLEYKVDAGTSTMSGTASGVTAREQMLGLSSNFGTVAGGYLQTTAWDFQNSYDPTSGATISPLGNVTVAGNFLIGSVAKAARASRALAYISPSMGGVTVAVNYSTALADQLGDLTLASNATTGLKTTGTLLSVNYAGGPLAVGGVYAKTTNDTTTAPLPAAYLNSKEYALGASFDFSVAKLFATYQSNTPTGKSANKAESVGATIPVGPGTVVVSYAKAKMATASTSASGETVGYLYSWSSTTTVYAAYSKMSQDTGTKVFSVDNSALGGGNMTVGGSSSLIAVGLRKKF